MLRLTAPQILQSGTQDHTHRTALQKLTVGEIYTATEMARKPLINNTSQLAHDPEHEHEPDHKHKHEREHEHEHEHEHAMKSWLRQADNHPASSPE